MSGSQVVGSAYHHPNHPTAIDTIGASTTASTTASSAGTVSTSAPALDPRSSPHQNGHIFPTNANTHSDLGPSRSHVATNSLYQCADCQRRYSRPEHLARHIQTHTLGKRFFCTECNKAFARADLLKRHAANHSATSANKKRKRAGVNGDAANAGRVSQACRACAAARVKCDEVKPCSRCRSRDVTCEFGSDGAGATAAVHLMHLSTHVKADDVDEDMGDRERIRSLQQEYNPIDQNSPSKSQMHRAPIQPIQIQTAEIPQFELQQTHMQQNQIQQIPIQQPAMREHRLQQHDLFPQVHLHQPRQQQSSLYQSGEQENKHEDRLLTSSTVSHHNLNPFIPTFVDESQIVDPFSYFLRDVMTLQPYDTGKQDEAKGLAVLNFCDDTNLELNDLDFGLLGYYNTGDMMNDYYPAGLDDQITVPRSEDSADMSQMRSKLAKIWTESPWRWTPGNLDHAYSEQNNLPVPPKDINSAQFHESRRKVDRVMPDRLEAMSRDKLLATVLSTCHDAATMRRIASSFPSVEVLDTLIHIFLASHLRQSSPWLHMATMKLNSQFPEWLAATLAAGAVITPVSTLRKFGFALQEAVRLAIVKRWEENNSLTRDLCILQGFVLHLDVGIWSGNRRKMEIATSHGQAPIIMLRAAGRFKRSSFTASTLTNQDDGSILEEKWKLWAAAESYKRSLCFHLFLRDAETSMTTLVNPILSYAEVTLPLPAPRELWTAKSAQEWKNLYLARMPANPDHIPSLLDVLRDVSIITLHHSYIDVQFSATVYLHAIWGMIFEYRQLDRIHRSSNGLAASTESTGLPNHTNLVLASRHQDINQTLRAFQPLLQDCSSLLSSQEPLLLNYLLMHLHLSLDDLQLFAGKDGDDSARRIYPTLQRWIDSRDARKALWHAGQVLRAAKLLPQNHLKDFYAVAMHHASLALWVWGVVTKASARSMVIINHQHQQQNHQPIGMSMGLLPPLPPLPPLQQRQFVHSSNDTIWLDGAETHESRHYIDTGVGKPAIQGPPGGKNADSGKIACVEDSQKCMEVCYEIIRANCGSEEDAVPPIVDNLSVLIKQLGNAAVGL